MGETEKEGGLSGVTSVLQVESSTGVSGSPWPSTFFNFILYFLSILQLPSTPSALYPLSLSLSLQLFARQSAPLSTVNVVDIISPLTRPTMHSADVWQSF